MIDERLLDVIQREIDGETTEEERAQLRERLSRDAEAAALLDEFREIADALNRISESDAPGDLRAAILERAAEKGLLTPRGTGGPIARFLRLFGIHDPSAGIGGVSMSRKMVFIGGGIVVAVALVAWYGLSQRPAGDEVTGAIGAVEKYREEQIGDQDVVLGDSAESLAHVPFGDLLTDAAVLENASLQLAAAAVDFEAKTLDAAGFQEKLGAIDDGLNSHAASLDARMQLAMKTQLVAVHRMLEANSSAFEAGDLERVKVELERIRGNLEAKTLDAAMLEGARTELAAVRGEVFGRVQFEAMSLARARSQLEAVATELDNRAVQLDRKGSDRMQADLEAAFAALEANTALEARAMKARGVYLEALSLEASSVLDTRNQLGSMRALEAARLGAMARTLDMRAKELQASSAKLEARALESMRLQLDAFSLDQATLDAMALSLAAGRRSLEARAETLDAMSLDNMNVVFGKIGNRLQQSQLAASQHFVGEMKTQIAATSRCLNRSQLEARMLNNMRVHLGMVSKQLDANRGKLEAQMLESMRVQLDATSRQLETHSSTLE